MHTISIFKQSKSILIILATIGSSALWTAGAGEIANMQPRFIPGIKSAISASSSTLSRQIEARANSITTKRAQANNSYPLLADTGPSGIISAITVGSSNNITDNNGFFGQFDYVGGSFDNNSDNKLNGWSLTSGYDYDMGSILAGFFINYHRDVSEYAGATQSTTRSGYSVGLYSRVDLLGFRLDGYGGYSGNSLDMSRTTTNAQNLSAATGVSELFGSIRLARDLIGLELFGVNTVARAELGMAGSRYEVSAFTETGGGDAISMDAYSDDTIQGWIGGDIQAGFGQYIQLRLGGRYMYDFSGSAAPVSYRFVAIASDTANLSQVSHDSAYGEIWGSASYVHSSGVGAELFFSKIVERSDLDIYSIGTKITWNF